MASQVTADGEVLAPLNISAPAPILNLRGFKWRTVDEKILGPQPGQEHENQVSAPEVTSFAVAAAPPSQRDTAPAPVAVQAAAALPAPQLPLSVTRALPTQLPGQLGVVPGRAAAIPPAFPLGQFQGAYAGNGFNLIWRPRPLDDKTVFPTRPPSQPDDNILELNLTTEQMTFGGTLGQIPNRGLSFNKQSDVFLGGLPYLQTVQDVTNIDTGKGDSPTPTDIHFEPGLWLTVPACSNPKNEESLVRMASIPHGTTINAQGLAPKRNQATVLGGRSGAPDFDNPVNVLDTTPFQIGKFTSKQRFDSMDATNQGTARIPQNLKKFSDAGTITTDIIKNPNLVLKNAIAGQKIVETIVFDVSTGPSSAPGSAKLNGGGTANISFLAGTQSPITTASPGNNDNPNAHAEFMTSRFWVETVAYQVNVPRLTTRDRVLLKPTMPKNSPAPTPVFAVTPPPKLPSEPTTITIPGIQIQYSQTVNLNFGPPRFILTWPHVSVATLVPSDPQPFAMT